MGERFLSCHIIALHPLLFCLFANITVLYIHTYSFNRIYFLNPIRHDPEQARGRLRFVSHTSVHLLFDDCFAYPFVSRSKTMNRNANGSPSLGRTAAAQHQAKTRSTSKQPAL